MRLVCVSVCMQAHQKYLSLLMEGITGDSEELRRVRLTLTLFKTVDVGQRFCMLDHPI